ncbi:MAG: hypothetical protein IK075_08390 [Prevotella sp.]|nr:hypothetical protein [Prevotella sp.]
MKKRIFGMLLMGAMVVASVSMFTSCKDYDDDINKLQKQIDEITAQNLQTQLNSLQSALSIAQSTADAAKAAAAEAEAAAKKAQETGDAATATATEAAAEAAATAVAAAQDVKDLEDAIADVKALLDGKVSKDELSKAIEDVEKKIAAINENLLTLDDVKKLLEDEGFASAAVVKDIESQIEALQAFQKKIEALKLDASWKKKVDDAVASLTQIKNDIAANTKSIADIKKLAEQASKDASGVTDSINKLNVFVKRLLTSLNLSPSKFYGGIEGTDIFSYKAKKETMYDKWHYFMNSGTMDLSEIGLVDYHVSPANVDLTKFDINFFTRTSEIIEPAATEKTRAAADNGRVKPVYGTTDLLMEQKDKNGKMLYWNAKTGILTVPFTAEASKIAADLDKSIANITAVQLSKKDTTVTSDYALVYPSFAYEFLVCDNSFDDADDKVEHQDVIGKDKGKVSSFHLHRNFSFLALSTTTATHEILYSGKFDITKVLETHYVDKDKLITDTVVRTPHTATAPDGKDSDAKVPVGNCHKLSADKLAQLGLHYEINVVDYTLGTTKTSESAHIELVEEKVGDEIHVMAYPRNIKPDGTTDKGNPANASAVGRMPIVCIELVKDIVDNKTGKVTGKQTISFAWMKFLITASQVTPEVKKTAFDLGDFYADCVAYKENGVKWNDIEYYVYNKLVGMSKEQFDNVYDFDQYEESTETVKTNDKTTVKNVRKGEQYKEASGKFTKLTAAQRLGEVIEEWNASDQKKEDATTHILKWRLYSKDFWTLYNTIKLDRSGSDIVNAEDVFTWVRYKRKGTADGEPAIYIKFTIPAGKLHFAKGTLDGSKTLTYWYNLNSDKNAAGTGDAKEVRVNVPVPTPGADVPYILSDEANCIDGDAQPGYISNNLLTETEFVKDLHDYFIDGKLNAKVADSHFSNLKNIVPEFEFTLPSKSLGNATFDAVKGQWTVKGFTGTTYTLQLNAAKNEILIAKAGNTTLSPMPVLVCLTKDLAKDHPETKTATTAATGVQSVIKYHEGKYQDDILNAYGHDKLGERETFTAYIQIGVKDACAPVEFDDMWFNVRFIRPLDLQNPKQGLLPDAPNDWQYVDLKKYIKVLDWREYLGDPNNTTGGAQKYSNADKKYLFDFAYYQIDFNTDQKKFMTDAHLGTAERDPQYTIGSMIDINDDAAYAKKLKAYTVVQGLDLEKVDATTIRYKNNSGVTGGFHVYVPVQMTYVFGQDASLTQTKYITLGITSTVEQPQ